MAAGGLAADGVDGDVAAAAGEVGDGGGHVVVRGQDVLGAEGGGGSECLGVAVDGYDAGTEGAGDHDGAEPDPAGADDEDPLALDHTGAGH